MKTDNVEDLYSLSPMQQGMLFHTLFAPESNIYLRQLSCRVEGDLHVEAFEGAWRELLRRHAVLRASFFWEDLSNPLQLINRRLGLPLARQDWRGLGGGEQEARLESLLREDRRRGFDLAAAPLMRLALVRLGEDSYHFVWTYHHLLLDGWSKSILFGELLRLYEALRAGDHPSLGQPRPYRDYIAWLRGQDLSQAEAFWREYLRGFRTPTPLPFDRDAPAGAPEEAGDPDGASGYAIRQLTLDERETAELQDFARRHSLTLNTLIQGAWALLLSRYGGGRDVLFGATVAGRPAELSGVETMVGVFINTLPARVRVDAEARVVDWLRELQAEGAAARQYEYSPLVEVSGWSELGRGARLFDSIVVFDNYPVEADAGGRGATLKVSDSRFVERNNYPLSLVVVPRASLPLQLSYDCSRFEEATIMRMLGHLRETLRGFVRAPESEVGRLDILTEEERRLLSAWNASARGGVPEGLVHELFERQAAATPDAVAVSDGESLTYAELNARANKLARRLRGLGVTPESRVGLCMSRSGEAVTGLLAILKAGGCYVPLDPAYPHERLTFMLEDAGISVLLTQQHLLFRLPPEAAGAEVVCVDTDWAEVESESGENLDAAATGDSLAYVIYTSGSTGRPKGVAVSHAAAAHHFKEIRDVFGHGPDDRVLEFASLSFDVSLEQMLAPLAAGAGVVMRDDEVWGFAECLSAIREARLTVVNLPTSLWHQFAREASGAGSESVGGLRLMISGGDVMTPEAVKLWQRSAFGKVRLMNAYGPTEAVITSTAYDVPERFGDADATRVPIGRAACGRSIYVLDAGSRPVPVGVAGELCVGGPLLARGYLNRPGLTAERFVPDPFSAEPGARLYKTGDLARFLEDGRVDFLGRADHQVKVRGFRVELGEIEAALARLPFVRDAVVAARGDATGEKLLAAYVVREDGAEVSAAEWREQLRDALPEHMIPSIFVALDALPLTPTGKVDRRALPEPGVEHSASGRQYVTPRNPVEEEMAGIWRELLGVERVGVHDNFFDLGGHSLLLTQLASRVRGAFQIEPPLRALFDAPTVEEMTALIVALQVEQGDASEVAQMLDELKRLTPDEVNEMLKADGA